MDSVKILHCGDFHLGSELIGLRGKAAERKRELNSTFRRVIALCKEHGVQFLLIAGDLFDKVGVSKDIVNYVRDSFVSIPEVIVAIAPGNHDPYSTDSPYAKPDYWPENVVIFGKSLQSVEFPGRGVRLWGAGFEGAYQRTSLLRGQRAPDDNLINLCVLHGVLMADERNADYHPIQESQIRQSGMQYIALGHQHKRTEILQADGVSYAYCGCPEGRGFDELGEKGVYLGEVSKESCRLEFVPTCQRQYVELIADITGASRASVPGILRLRMEDACGEDYAKHLYKVRLQGAVDDEACLDFNGIATGLSDVYYLKLVDETTLAVDLEGLQLEQTLRGGFVRRMIKQMDSGKEQSAPDLELALKIGLRAFSGKVNYHED